MKSFVPLLCVLAGCGTTDDRPETLAYITETILAPNCAAAECHSALKKQSGYVFDSVADAQDAIVGTNGSIGTLVSPCATPPCDNAPGNSLLLTVITDKDSFGHRMPLDHPLPNLDDVLIANWIRDGAAGYSPP